MHFRLSSRLAKSVKAKCRTISDQYTDYRRNRRIAKSTKSVAHDSLALPSRGGTSDPWKGEPYRFANDSDDWDRDLVSDSESDIDSNAGH
ncbi:hypothetical protein N0V84_004835 [Fusarium piperis]|uniref:Uncharacterized protein n=1 Tax=Fusarium piperis TaxID=1435070 RepID=A0A9W8WES7_9HYPO|nr:hypothetical protein N0V84_004835 [Fusarium piperis]